MEEERDYASLRDFALAHAFANFVGFHAPLSVSLWTFSKKESKGLVLTHLTGL